MKIAHNSIPLMDRFSFLKNKGDDLSDTTHNAFLSPSRPVPREELVVPLWPFEKLLCVDSGPPLLFFVLFYFKALMCFKHFFFLSST